LEGEFNHEDDEGHAGARGEGAENEDDEGWHEGWLEDECEQWQEERDDYKTTRGRLARRTRSGECLVPVSSGPWCTGRLRGGVGIPVPYLAPEWRCILEGSVAIFGSSRELHCTYYSST
jgi:hypothetical protein